MPKHGKRRKARAHQALPKGAYRLPTGGYVTTSIGNPNSRGRHIRIVAVHRDEPDADKIARALIEIILDQARHPDD